MTDFRWFSFVLALVFSVNLFAQHQEVESLNVLQLRKQLRGANRANDHYSQIDFLEELVERKPDKLKYKYQLARAYDEARNYQRALEEYSKVYYADQEKYAPAIYHMGRIMKHRRQYKLAELYFNQFLEKHNHGKEARHFKKLVKAEIEGCHFALEKEADDIPRATIEPVKGDINYSNIEFSPNIIDSATFWYVSLPSNEVVFLESDSMPYRRIYEATFDGSSWQRGDMIAHPSNDLKQHIGSFALSEDKKRMYFSLCKPNWQNRIICKIYQSRFENGEWLEPELLPEEVMSTNHTYTHPSVGSSSKKGREIIYFVSDRQGGKGGYDIWYTRYRIDKHKFEKARNSGSKVNTIADELSPSFDFQSNTLYFSSNGRPGIGGFDIFQAVGERSRWMEPSVNSGKQINSPYDEFYYSPFPYNRTKALLVSNREGSTALKHPHCCDDLFEVNWSNLVTLTYEVKLTDEETKKPLVGGEVLVTVRDSPEGEILVLQRIRTDQMGKANLLLDPKLEYKIILESDKHFNGEFSIQPQPIEQSTRKQKEVLMKPIPDEEIVIPNIYYPFDKAYLTPEAQIAIDTSIYEILTENPTLIVEIGSHTDSKGTEKYNEHLSQRRAESVVNYLMSKGIDKKRLKAQGYGESKPVAPNQNADGSDNPSGRAKNRRTSFRVLGQLDVDIYYEDP